MRTSDDDDVAAMMEEDYDEEDEDERPTRLALVIGLAAHLTLRLIGMVRRLHRPAPRRRQPSTGRPARSTTCGSSPVSAASTTTPGPPARMMAGEAIGEEDFGEPVDTSRVSAPAPRPKAGRRAVRETRKSTAKSGFVLPPIALLSQPKVGQERPPSARPRSSRTPACWKACSTISASAARSSTSVPARWSPSTNWSRRRASSRRASSALPTTSPAR